VFFLLFGGYRIRKDLITVQPASTTLLNYFHYIPVSWFHFLSFGYDNIFSDWVWIATLQKSLLDHRSTEQDFLELYNLAQITTELDKRIELAYRYIGLTLIFFDKNDFGEKLLMKGVKNKIQDWQLYMVLGWFHMDIKKDPKTALYYYKKSSEYPDSPPYFKSLIVRLAIEKIDSYTYEARRAIAKQMLKVTEDEKIRKRIIDRLKKLEEDRLKEIRKKKNKKSKKSK